MVMVNVCQGFSVITKIFTMVNDCWLAVILSAGFWLVKITNLLNKRNFLFDSNVDWKKKIARKLHHSCDSHSLNGDPPLFMQNKCLYIISSFQRKKRDSNKGVFLWNLWNFQEQWWLLLKTCNIIMQYKIT